jgi:hypothetical protein
MSLISRRELLNQLTGMYPEANWAEKRRILDEFVAATGWEAIIPPIKFQRGRSSSAGLNVLATVGWVIESSSNGEAPTKTHEVRKGQIPGLCDSSCVFTD